MDFTTKVFTTLLTDLKASGYQFFRFDHYFQNRKEIEGLKRVICSGTISTEAHLRPFPLPG